MVSASLLHPGSLVAGKYVVERVLAQGGTGIIALCRHEGLGQRVALKVLRSEAQTDEGTRSRFLREARAAARLESQHVARVTDVGDDPHVGPFYVMEYLEGCDLEQLLRARGHVPPVEAVDLVLEAIDAIAEAHAMGIVHRDLKPANLFLADRTDGTKVVKVLDFGISKSLGQISQNATASSDILGSPSYMSPEQVRDPSRVDARADIWSLGVVLYELVTGSLPFAIGSVAVVLLAIVEDEPRPPRTLAPELSVAFEQVIVRCLAKEPAARFASVAALAEALGPFGSSRATRSIERAATLLGHSRAPSVLPPAPAPAPVGRRSRGALAAFAVFGFVLLAAIALFAIFVLDDR